MAPTNMIEFLGPDELKLLARWIRDHLDPMIAREGPQALKPDDVLYLHDMFIAFAKDPLGVGITSQTLRYSRMHRAILDITGKATRWPGRLVDLCDEVVEVWEKLFGRLKEMPLLLYGEGGRLWRILKPGYFTLEVDEAYHLGNKFADGEFQETVQQWKSQRKAPRGLPNLLDLAAMEHGDIGFQPGQWWINQSLAFHDGIINNSVNDGGIVYDENGAYAVVLTGSDEFKSDDPNTFWFHTRCFDKGRYRLTSADNNSRYPIRVLRTHTLHSPWAPKVGIRYDGLHRVSSWSIKLRNGEIMYDIQLIRQGDEQPMTEVMLRPWADEREDYVEYRRLRNMWREESHKRTPQRARKHLHASDISDEDAANELFDPFAHFTAQEKNLKTRGMMLATDTKLTEMLAPRREPSRLLSRTPETMTMTTKSLEMASKVASRNNGAKDGAMDEGRLRTRHLFDGSEDDGQMILPASFLQARDSPPPEEPINAAVSIGRQFSQMSLVQLQTINAMHSEHIAKRRTTPETLAAQHISPRSSYSDLSV